MRTVLLTLFWLMNAGGAIQLLVIASACWIVLSSTYAFSDLSVDVYISQFFPWFLWVKELLVVLFGELGTWILSIPIFMIATFKLVVGTVIGFWAYSVAMNMPADSVHGQDTEKTLGANGVNRRGRRAFGLRRMMVRRSGPHPTTSGI